MTRTSVNTDVFRWSPEVHVNEVLVYYYSVFAHLWLVYFCKYVFVQLTVVTIYLLLCIFCKHFQAECVFRDCCGTVDISGAGCMKWVSLSTGTSTLLLCHCWCFIQPKPCKFWVSTFVSKTITCIFTMLHVMQTRYSDENSVRLSHACIVTKQKKDLSRFLHHTKDNLA